MRASLLNIDELSKEYWGQTKKYFAKLRKKSPKNLDFLMQELHEAEFKKTNCLDCANCCKTTSPIFSEKDIERISKYLKIKAYQFIKTYLKRDEDDFMILKQAPCAFLDQTDNNCLIYKVRPKACSEYPHTNRKRFIQLTDLTLKNTEICPAVVNIVEMMKKRVPL
jgi:hypothetical protein